MPKTTRKADVPADPDKLVRREAGTYRTADERFEVRQAGAGWFVVDSQQMNEFGQALMLGPFGTLEAVRGALPEARSTEVKPKAPPIARPKPSKSLTPERAKPPPPSWIDQLPKAAAAEVRRLIAALEREGVQNAESLVRRDRDGQAPQVAGALIERRMAELLGDVPAGEQDNVRGLIRRIVRILTVEGTGRHDSLPGWALVETDRNAVPPGRRIILRG